MSATTLLPLYDDIQRANPMIPVLALAIYKREQVGDVVGAEQRHAQFEANYGSESTQALDVCLLVFRQYGVPK